MNQVGRGGFLTRCSTGTPETQINAMERFGAEYQHVITFSIPIQAEQISI